MNIRSNNKRKKLYVKVYIRTGQVEEWDEKKNVLYSALYRLMNENPPTNQCQEGLTWLKTETF